MVPNIWKNARAIVTARPPNDRAQHTSGGRAVGGFGAVFPFLGNGGGKTSVGTGALGGRIGR
jgi:hypothetical protein